ncbi:MAG: glycosyltransferase family 2 protein [Roseobacter sp.]|nr:glycosyltransferase family 2 protein [Roseobacter sp.]
MHRGSLLARYKLRLRRKRLLWRAFRKRQEIRAVSRKTAAIRSGKILMFATVRNEALRLPFFLNHYRKLGVDHFLIVDNASDDGSAVFLQDEPDVSLWTASASYKASRFGMDWLTCLQWRYGHGKWIVTADADELLVYPDWETRRLGELTKWLDRHNLCAMGALMLDLYPKGPVSGATCRAGQDPTDLLQWMDAYGYWAQLQPKMGNLWLQGGPRARMFFADNLRLAPTLNKIPLVRWDRAYVYVNSTHNALPARLNQTYDTGGYEKPTGALLHTKFLPDVAARAAQEKQRGEHFARADTYGEYYDLLSEGPDFWHEGSVRYEGWEQLMRLRLIFGGEWHP